MTQPTKDPRDLVVRLTPSWAVDEEISRAAAKTSIRVIVTAFLVENNALKREAADAIEALIAERDDAISNFAVLQRAVVGSTGLSGITIASDLRTRAEAAEARALAAEAGEARMREALKPFADVGGSIAKLSPSDTSPWATAPDTTPYGNQGLTFGDFRRAALALKETEHG